MRLERCKLCKRPIRSMIDCSEKRNKYYELPNTIHLELIEENIKSLRRGRTLEWFINDKKKMGYFEIEISMKRKSASPRNSLIEQAAKEQVERFIKNNKKLMKKLGEVRK